MTPRSAAATYAAQRFWAHAAGDASAPEEIAAVAERVCTQLRTGLGRWIGTDAYRTLFDRALGLVRAEHPALGGFSCLEAAAPMTAAAIQAHGAAEVAASMVAFVSVLIELLSHVVDEEMAVRLVEQMGTPRPRGGGRTHTAS